VSGLVFNLLFPLASIPTPTGDRRASDVLNDIMPGLITLAVVAVWLALIAIGRPVPDALAAILQVVVGFYFGQHVAMAAARGILASNASASDAAAGAATAASNAQVAAVAAANAAAANATAAATTGTTKP
jgi:hypothetical protein